jgi:hypothetical protein
VAMFSLWRRKSRRLSLLLELQCPDDSVSGPWPEESQTSGPSCQNVMVPCQRPATGLPAVRISGGVKSKRANSIVRSM